MKGAFYTGQYRNVFAELGHSQEEIAQKLKDAFYTVFYGCLLYTSDAADE